MHNLRFRSGVAIGIAIGVLCSAVAAYAVNFTVVLTQAEVDIATWKWNQVDPSHTQYATAQLFGGARVSELIQGWKGERTANRRRILGDPTGYFCTNTWGSLNGTQQNAVCTGVLVEVTACTPCDANGN
jgi:hypothetical protein